MIRDTGNGLVVGDHDTTRAAALDEARTYLLGEGLHPFDVDAMLVDRHDLIVRAWWFADDSGFAMEHQDGASPVLVVHTSAPRVIAEHDAIHAAEAVEWAARAAAERAAAEKAQPVIDRPALTRFPEDD